MEQTTHSVRYKMVLKESGLGLNGGGPKGRWKGKGQMKGTGEIAMDEHFRAYK